jgi:hypothetical protein
MQIAVIGLDLAKNVFQVLGIDDSGQAVLKRKLRRSEVLPFFAGLAPALVGIEACHTAHYWGREIAALGHDARLMPPHDAEGGDYNFVAATPVTASSRFRPASSTALRSGPCSWFPAKRLSGSLATGDNQEERYRRNLRRHREGNKRGQRMVV